MQRLLSRLKSAHQIQVGLLVLASRFLGFARDAVYACFFGACWQYDALVVAYRIPNMLRDLLAEGALSSAVVARLGQVEAREGRARVAQLVRRLVAFWGLALLGVALLGALCAPWLGGLMGLGFSEEKAALTVRLTRLLFPYIAVMGMAALTMGVLQHLRVYTWSTAGSVFSNVVVIGLVSAWFLLFQGDPAGGVVFAAWAILASGLAQWLAQTPGLAGSGVSLRPEFRFRDPELRKVLLLVGPSVLGVAAVQVNVAVNTVYATFLYDGAVSHANFAFRVMQLPIGVVGVAVSTVLLPELTALHAKGEDAAFGGRLERALLDVSRMAVPAVAGIVFLGPDLIRLFYERGRFTPADTAAAWLALSGYLPGILVYAWNKSLVQAYYARGDVATPVAVSVASIAVNAGLNSWLVFRTDLGLRGLTLGTSAVLAVNCLALLAGLVLRHRLRLAWASFLARLAGMALAGAGMLAALRLLRPLAADQGVWVRVPALTAAGAAVYFALLFAGGRLARFASPRARP